MFLPVANFVRAFMFASRIKITFLRALQAYSLEEEQGVTILKTKHDFT